MSGSIATRTPTALSIVIACDGALTELPDRLRAIAQACRGIAVEAIVVHPADARVETPGEPPVPTRRIVAPSALVPVLWGQGIAASRGNIVALTTTQFRVTPDWARHLLAAFTSERVAGAGGSIALAPDADRIGAAVFLIRYSEHMGALGAGAPRDIAGDNAAYRRDAVLRVCPDVAAGFWEVDVHRLMRAAGDEIRHVPAAVSEFSPASTLGEMIGNRFVHGSHYGAYRVEALRWPRWRAIAVTPLVPAVLMARIVGRMRRAGQPLSRFGALSPLMLPLLVAWAAGEARGAMSSSHR